LGRDQLAHACNVDRIDRFAWVAAGERADAN
jgi:hypothetical protein